MASQTGEPSAELGSLEAAAESLGASLAARDVDAGGRAADAIVSLTSDLLVGLPLERSGIPEAHAELVAALHVYRNAAFAFRRFAGAAGAGDDGLAIACAEMLGQGHDHLQRYYELGGAPDPFSP